MYMMNVMSMMYMCMSMFMSIYVYVLLHIHFPLCIVRHVTHQAGLEGGQLNQMWASAVQGLCLHACTGNELTQNGFGELVWFTRGEGYLCL